MGDDFLTTYTPESKGSFSLSPDGFLHAMEKNFRDRRTVDDLREGKRSIRYVISDMPVLVEDVNGRQTVTIKRSLEADLREEAKTEIENMTGYNLVKPDKESK